MWKSLKINGENYFFKCESLEAKINYSLTDLKFIWSEEILMDLFVTKIKDFNKRIEYTTSLVLKTIKSEIPDQINFGNVSKDKQVRDLNLKYYVSGRPLIFEWKLKLCEQSEFLKLIINPLLLSIGCLTRQNEELLDIIRKKDNEISQYKQEGAILRRTKIATEPFDNIIFERKFLKIILSENILKYANDNFSNLKRACEGFIVENEISEELPNISLNESSSTSQKRTPTKSRKKRFLENQKQLLEQRLKAREKKIDYEDSDSPCTPPPTINENPDVMEIKKRLNELKRRHEEDLQNLKTKTVKK